MSPWFYVLPIVGAVLGWSFVALVIRRLFHPFIATRMLGFSLQGVVPKKQLQLAAALGDLSADLISFQEIEDKITHRDNVKKMMPQAEVHIDHFLRVKLVKSMPVVGMFVGDKTINTLKELFITELETLFPEIMKTYLGELQQDFNIRKMVRDKIASFPPADMEKFCNHFFKAEFRRIKLVGALLGFVISCLQLALSIALIS